MNHDATYRRGERGYIIQAGVEYLISILVTGSFLATLTAYIGLSDSLTGILSAIVSLGCLFQLLSIPLHCRNRKRFVLLMSVGNQLLFLLLFVIPLLPVSGTVRAALFTVSIVSAYVLYNMAHPKKIHWLMSLIHDEERGQFTAKKEIVSLVAGILFSYAMGAVVDWFRDTDRLSGGLLLCGGVVLVLIIAHTVTLAQIPEKPLPATRAPLAESFRQLIGQPVLRRVILVFAVWYMAQYTAIPFYGTYQIHELNFSLKLVSLISIAGSAVRIACSRAWGRYADRASFAAMMQRCLLLMCAAYLCAALSSPSLALVPFLLYSLFSGAAHAGINSALINLVYDYVPEQQRADALALCQACAGTVGFLTTLAMSPLMSLVQELSPTLFGVPVYAQQLFSLLALALTVLTVCLVRRLPARRS